MKVVRTKDNQATYPNGALDEPETRYLQLRLVHIDSETKPKIYYHVMPFYPNLYFSIKGIKIKSHHCHFYTTYAIRSNTSHASHTLIDF